MDCHIGIKSKNGRVVTGCDHHHDTQPDIGDRNTGYVRDGDCGKDSQPDNITRHNIKPCRNAIGIVTADRFVHTHANHYGGTDADRYPPTYANRNRGTDSNRRTHTHANRDGNTRTDSGIFVLGIQR